MKVFAHHDAEGNIHSLVTLVAPEGSGMMLVPEPGLLVTEIEDPKVPADDEQKLREFIKTYKVATTRGTLKPHKP